MPCLDPGARDDFHRLARVANLLDHVPHVGSDRVTNKIPDSGPLPAPKSPAEAREYLKAASFEAPKVDDVTMVGGEFTSVCPKTGQPDFGTVSIRYTPHERCIESRSLKYYLWSYRTEPAFCEALAARIADDIVYAIDPQWVDVEVEQASRGGIQITARASRER